MEKNKEILPEEQPAKKEGEEVTLTQEELQAKLQSEADRRVSEALKTAKSKWQQEYESKLEQEKKEAERLAQLSAEEKEKELLKQKEEEILERERTLKRKELELDTVDRLADEGLPLTFKGLLIGEDAESTNENIKVFKEEWTKAIEEEMKKRVATTGVSRNPSNTKTVSLGEQLAKAGKVEKKKHNFF